MTYGDFVQGDFVLRDFVQRGFCPRGFCPRGFCLRGFFPKPEHGFTVVIKVFIASVDIKRGTASWWTCPHVSPDFKEVNYNVHCRNLETRVVYALN